ncbi:MAG: hypothetical protein IT521_09640 [Burkholderiales bacterium]|nr:hypothetical protein [Burkholderiales bacterium]
MDAQRNDPDPQATRAWREALSGVLADDDTIAATTAAEAIAKYGVDPDKPAPWTV